MNLILATMVQGTTDSHKNLSSRTASINAPKVTTERIKKETQWPNRGEAEAEDMAHI